MSEIYGGEHLLRLFVKLPGLLSATKLDKKELEVLLEKVYDFIKYLDSRTHGSNALFNAPYKQTDKIYQDKASQI
jgi:mortality factor 4-like protein 1